MQSTDIIVFLGPTLPKARAQVILPNALYLPPVRCGDIVRALRLRPKVIAIIDGFFENTAAVWHKEILFALEQNIQVFGAASMGALRAAELADFGMIGVGKIYQDYRQGKLTNDDEVCVVHRPQLSQFEAVSDAMVNIRATLDKAVNAKIIHAQIAKQIAEIAQSQYYKTRSLHTACEIAVIEGVDSAQTEQLLHWIAQGHGVNQKAEDAILLLNTLKDGIPILHSKHQNPSFKTNASLFFRTLYLDAMCRPLLQDDSILPNNERLALHARLLGHEYRLNRLLAYLLAAVSSICDYHSITQEECLLMQPVERMTLDQLIQHLPIFADLPTEEIVQLQATSLFLLIAQCWSAVVWHIQQLKIDVTVNELQQYADNFRKTRHLLSAEATFAFMKSHQLDGPGFEMMLLYFYYLDIFVLKNNFDQIQLPFKPHIYWLWEALTLSGSVKKAEQLLTDPTAKAMAVKTLQTLCSFDEFFHTLDFLDENDFSKFAG